MPRSVILPDNATRLATIQPILLPRLPFSPAGAGLLLRAAGLPRTPCLVRQCAYLRDIFDRFSIRSVLHGRWRALSSSRLAVLIYTFTDQRPSVLLELVLPSG